MEWFSASTVSSDATRLFRPTLGFGSLIAPTGVPSRVGRSVASTELRDEQRGQLLREGLLIAEGVCRTRRHRVIHVTRGDGSINLPLTATPGCAGGSRCHRGTPVAAFRCDLTQSRPFADSGLEGARAVGVKTASPACGGGATRRVLTRTSTRQQSPAPGERPRPTHGRARPPATILLPESALIGGCRRWRRSHPRRPFLVGLSSRVRGPPSARCVTGARARVGRCAEIRSRRVRGRHTDSTSKAFGRTSRRTRGRGDAAGCACRCAAEIRRRDDHLSTGSILSPGL
jgi:hypothetical protein